MKKVKILGVDWGKKRIGLAFSDDGLAEPLGVVGSPSELIKTAKERCIEKVVLGLPEGKYKREVEELGGRLEKELGVEVVFQNEVLSTKAALKGAIEAGKKKKTRRELDALAASTLLQEYLDLRLEC